MKLQQDIKKMKRKKKSEIQTMEIAREFIRTEFRICLSILNIQVNITIIVFIELNCFAKKNVI
jgi:uncharacterized membrane protein (DUF106 family)